MADVKCHNGLLVCKQEYKPVTFNPWKHHCNFVCNQIEHIRRTGDPAINQYLNYIGGTLLDFYIGDLTINLIINEIKSFFTGQDIYNVEAFRHWLGLPNKTYKSIVLSDGSRWVLRLGQNEEFYIHTHPGRYSPLTVRCRPVTLKVAIAYRYLFGFDYDDFDIRKVNFARKVVGLPPVRSLYSVSALLTFTSILTVNNH